MHSERSSHSISDRRGEMCGSKTENERTCYMERVVTRTHAFRKTEEPDNSLADSLGVWFFYLHFKHSLLPREMNHSPVSNADFTLQTEDMRNFQSFLGRKTGHTLNSHPVFPSLPSVGRKAPGKAALVALVWVSLSSLPWRDVETRSTLFKIANI